MTREEAREILQEQIDKYGKVSSAEGIKALRFAIEALEQEPCEDAISRQAVLEQINCWIDGREYEYTNATYYLTKRMQGLPPVSPKTKIGRWARELIRNEYGGCIGAKMICSECGQDNGYDKRMKFCPNCGCKMREVEE